MLSLTKRFVLLFIQSKGMLVMINRQGMLSGLTKTQDARLVYMSSLSLMAGSPRKLLNPKKAL
jgi:hypothetical protein